MAGGNVLERAGLRKAHRRRDRAREVEAEDRVSELAGRSGRPAVDPPAEHQSAADARGNDEHHQVAGDELQLLVVGLGERGEVRVVVDEHRDAEAVLQHLTEGNVGQRQIDCAVRRRCSAPRGRDDASGVGVHNPRHADTDRAQVVRPGAAHHGGELVDQRRAVRALRPADDRLAEPAVTKRRHGNLGGAQVDADNRGAHVSSFASFAAVLARGSGE